MPGRLPTAPLRKRFCLLLRDVCIANVSIDRTTGNLQRSVNLNANAGVRPNAKTGIQVVYNFSSLRALPS
jgi:hypothetical protein